MAPRFCLMQKPHPLRHPGALRAADRKLCHQMHLIENVQSPTEYVLLPQRDEC